MNRRITILAALAPAAWGTTYLVTSELLPPDSPLFSALLRALPAGLVALAIGKALPTGGWWWKALLLGVLNIGAFFPLLFVAAYRLPGGVAATLGAAQPLIIAGLAVLVLGERLSSWRLWWGSVGLVGVALVVLRSNAALDMVGVVAGLVAAGAMALGVTLTKRWGRPAGVSPVALVGWQLTAGGLFLVPLVVAFEGAPGHVDAGALVGWVWLGGVGGLLAYTLWFTGIGRIPVGSVAVLGLISPLVAAGLGAAVVGERLGAIQIVGFGLALAAIVASQVSPRPRNRIGLPRRRPVLQEAPAVESSGLLAGAIGR
jgi:probable blue pigment (indigoidine) exporter